MMSPLDKTNTLSCTTAHM